MASSTALVEDYEEEYDSKKVLLNIKRQLNILKESDMARRKSAIFEVKLTLDENKVNMRPRDMEGLLLEFSKMLLQCFADESEKIRETSVTIFTELVARAEDVTPYLRYIFEALVQRLNCHDLEGIEGLDPKLVPTPSQKPHQMAKLVEASEVVRMGLLGLAKTLIEVLGADDMRTHIDEMISILSVLLMDPAPEIQTRACKLTSDFVVNFKELVFHFTVRIARAILLPLSSKKSAIKIAAIQSLHDLLFCGTWKYTVDVFDLLVGFRDPNSVPIKDFYEPSHNLNYFAILINNPNPSVREAFLQMVADLLISLPDKYDVETRLIPYFLTGLFDDFKEIRVLSLHTGNFA